MMNRGGGDYGISNPNFCDDILCEILSRLRVKSLLRFKCTCKHWQSLIESPRFVELHRSRSKTVSLIMTTLKKSKDYKIDLFLGEDLLEGETPVEWLQSISSYEKPEVLRPVNGLFCIVNNKAKCLPGARIYNPSTQQISTYSIGKTYKIKKEKIEVYPRYGFGFDPATKEHKVICILEIKNGWGEETVEVVCYVLTVGKNTKWRRIDEVPPYLLEEDLYFEKDGYYANGSIYWMVRNSYDRQDKVIVAFDVGSEKFRVIPFPDFIHGTLRMNNTLFEVQGRIALFQGISVNKLWIYDDVNKEVMTNTTSTRNNWIEETISLTFSRDGSRVTLYAIAGTDLIFLKLRGIFLQDPPRWCDDLYYYDQKKKTSGKVNIIGNSSLHNADLIRCVGIFVESLWPVYRQQPACSQPPSITRVLFEQEMAATTTTTTAQQTDGKPMKVDQLKPGTSGHTLAVKVVSSKTVLLKSRAVPQSLHQTRIAECLVGDETGSIVFTARNEQIDMMKPGDTVSLHNAKIDMFRGFMRLAVDKWGRIEVTEPAKFVVKEDNNLSLVEYELVTIPEEEEGS